MPNRDNNTEYIVRQLVRCLEEGKTDQYDTMLMLSLVNLIEITKVIEGKKSLESRSSAGEENKLMGMLFNVLGEQQRGSRQGGQGGFDPAILLPLLGAQGKSPENALLMSLLSKIMQPAGQGNQPSRENKAKSAAENKGSKPKPIRTDNKENRPNPVSTESNEGLDKKVTAAAEKKMKKVEQPNFVPSPVKKESKEKVISWDRRLG